MQFIKLSSALLVKYHEKSFTEASFSSPIPSKIRATQASFHKDTKQIFFLFFNFEINLLPELIEHWNLHNVFGIYVMLYMISVEILQPSM